MPKNKHLVLDCTPDGTLYMPIKMSGIHPMIVMMGELPITVFGTGKRKQVRVKLTDVIAWYRREAEHPDTPPKRAEECRKIAASLQSKYDEYKARERSTTAPSSE